MFRTFYLVLFLIVFNQLMLEKTSAMDHKHFLLDLNYQIPNENLEQCVTAIMYKNFACNTYVNAVFSNPDVVSLIEKINKEDCFSIFIRTYQNENWHLRINVYLILAKDVFEFTVDIFQITKDVMWNPKAYFIIHFQNATMREVQKTFEICLRNKMTKVIVLTRIDEGEIQIYTYFPFNNNTCGEYIKTIRYLGSCHNINDIDELFPKNKIDDVRKCTIRVAATEDIPNVILETSNYTIFSKYMPGLEQYLLQTIAEIEEIQLEYQFSSVEFRHGVVLPNRTCTGILSKLQTGEVSMVAGGFLLIKNRVEMFDYIWGYNYAAFSLLTPAITEKTWKKVIREFGKETWFLIVVSWILVSAVVLIIRGWSLSKQKNNFTLMMKLWSYYYGHTDQKLLRIASLKSIIILWALFTFFINSFYNTSYFSLVTGRFKEQRPLDPYAIDSLPYKPCISETVRTFFAFAYNNLLPKDEGGSQCRYTETSLSAVASRQDLYAIELDYSYKLREYMYIDQGGNSKIDALDFLIDNVMAIYVHRGFPLTAQFQKYAIYMFESGLLQQYLKTIYIKNLSSQHSNQTFQKVRLADLRIHYGVLFVGYIISFMSFLIERRKKIAIPI